jgi:hypothetical protein
MSPLIDLFSTPPMVSKLDRSCHYFRSYPSIVPFKKSIIPPTPSSPSAFFLPPMTKIRSQPTGAPPRITTMSSLSASPPPLESPPLNDDPPVPAPLQQKMRPSPCQLHYEERNNKLKTLVVLCIGLKEELTMLITSHPFPLS